MILEFKNTGNTPQLQHTSALEPLVFRFVDGTGLEPVTFPV